MRCPYCHNPDLVLKERFVTETEQEKITEDFFSYVLKRKNLLDGVVFSGGEPLLQADLQEVLYQLKNEGFSIKLDTNGLLPNLLKDLVTKGLIDYVALDYKSNFSGWHKATGIESTQSKESQYIQWQKSLRILDQYSVPYELRTTVVKGIHRRDDLMGMGKDLNALIKKSAPKWFLQRFEKSQMVLSDYKTGGIVPLAYSRGEMTEICKDLHQIMPTVQLR